MQGNNVYTLRYTEHIISRGDAGRKIMDSFIWSQRTIESQRKQKILRGRVEEGAHSKPGGQPVHKSMEIDLFLRKISLTAVNTMD